MGGQAVSTAQRAVLLRPEGPIARVGFWGGGSQPAHQLGSQKVCKCQIDSD